MVVHLNTQALRVLFICLSFWAAGTLTAQVCQCPVITLSQLETTSCQVNNSGACVTCVGSPITLRITDANKLPPGGSVRWFSDPNPDFDPAAGQGTLRHAHVIPNILCNLANQVKINEFQPWPPVGDNNFSDSSTGEWIELIGPPGTNIGCYILTDGDWTVTIPPGQVIPPNGLYVIGYAQYGPVNLDVGTCDCSNSGAPNETLVLENQGEYLALWNGFSYVDAVRYGNPSLANLPPFGNLVNMGALPTVGLMGCSAQIPITYPAFSTVPALPQVNHTYEREPDLSGPFKLENCGSRGQCNVDTDMGLPLEWTWEATAADCGQTLYFKALIDPLPAGCTQGPNGFAAGPFALTITCPDTLLALVLCPGDSLVVNGEVYNEQRPSGSEWVNSFLGCDSLVVIDLQFTPPVIVGFPEDTAICQGDSLWLVLQFSGEGPFSFGLTANDSLILEAVTSDSAGLWVQPSDTTRFQLLYVEDSRGCRSTDLDGFLLGVNAPSLSWAILPPLICLGDTARVTFTPEGGLPFDILLLAGTDTLLFTIAGEESYPLHPTDTTAYRLLSATDHRGCPIPAGATDTLLVSAPLEIIQLEVNCTEARDSYQLLVTLSGGIPAGYTITGTTGQLSGNVWVSDSLPNLAAYDIRISDGGPCPERLLQGQINCDCSRNPGLLAGTDTLQLCPGQSSSAVFEVDPLLDPGDTLLYLLFTQSGNPLGSLLAASPNPGFAWQPGWPLHQVVWLAAAVSRPGPGGLDPTDPCLQISNARPVIFRETPALQLSLPAAFCGDECLDVPYTAQGQGTLSWTLLWGNPASPQAINGSGSPGTGVLTLCGDVFPGDLSLQLATLNDAYCSAAAGPAITIAHIQPVTLEYRQILCAGDTLLLHGKAYHAQQLQDTFILPAIAAEACDTLVIVDLTLAQPGQGQLQLTLCEGSGIQVGNQWFDQSNPAGQVVLPQAAASGCDSLVIVNLTFSNLVIQSLTALLCPGDSLLVGNQYFHAGNPNGSVSFPGGAQSGCDSLVDVALTFHPAISLTLSGTGALCPGDSIALQWSGAPLPFDITIGTGPANSQTYSQVSPGQPLWLTPSASGSYRLLQAQTAGYPCPIALLGSAELTVDTLRPTLVITSDYQGAAISCAGRADGSLQVQLAGTGYTYLWEDGSTSASRNNLPAGTYSVTVTNSSGCQGEVSRTLTAPAPLTMAARVQESACDAGSILLGNVNGGTPPYAWSLDGQQWQALPAPPLRPGAGSRVLRVRDANGCLTDTTLLVPAGADPIQLLAFPDTVIYLGQTVQLGALASVPVATYQWSPGKGLSCTNCPAPLARPAGSTTYLLRITDEQGCPAEAEVTIETLDDADFIYFPTAFSPNFDGINDRYLPLGDGLRYQVVQGMVYDRWGNELWRVAEVPLGDLNQGWDGSSRGRPLDNGVYIYTFRVRNTLTGAERSFSGEIQLLR